MSTCSSSRCAGVQKTSASAAGWSVRGGTHRHGTSAMRWMAPPMSHCPFRQAFPFRGQQLRPPLGPSSDWHKIPRAYQGLLLPSYCHGYARWAVTRRHHPNQGNLFLPVIKEWQLLIRAKENVRFFIIWIEKKLRILLPVSTSESSNIYILILSKLRTLNFTQLLVTKMFL